jgi:hypothetical protein
LQYRGRVAAITVLLALLAVPIVANSAKADLEKPTYAAGDRWVYIVQGDLGALPGFNRTAGPMFHLDLNGLVETDVVGPAKAMVNGVSVPSVQVMTHASGYLNGTFAIPGNTTINVSGTFASDTSEIWEDRGYLPVSSNSSSSYLIDVTFVVTTQVHADLWLNATTTYASIPPFNLSVGATAAAPSTTSLSVISTISYFGSTQHMANRTTFASTWSRQVLDQETVTVDAGTFSAYRLNESLGNFPGFVGVVPGSGANETAWFSNDVGYYVKRVAYVNGTQVAEMRLKSYSYPASSQGLPLEDLALLAAVPTAAAAILLFFVLRRRRRRPSSAQASSGVGPIGELPPKDPGGGNP